MNKKVWVWVTHLGNNSPQSLSGTLKDGTSLSVPLSSSHKRSTR